MHVLLVKHETRVSGEHHCRFVERVEDRPWQANNIHLLLADGQHSEQPLKWEPFVVQTDVQSYPPPATYIWFMPLRMSILSYSLVKHVAPNMNGTRRSAFAIAPAMTSTATVPPSQPKRA